MHLEVSFKNLKPREEIRKRAQALFGKLDRFLDATTQATLVVGVEHGTTGTELTVNSHGQIFQASDADEDLRTALDRTFHTIEVSLRRAKERRLDRRRENTDEVDGFSLADDDEGAAGTA